MKALYIFNKDLRLTENKTLEEACKSKKISFLYLKPKNLSDFGKSRLRFLIESVESLGESLREKGHELFICEDIDAIENKNFNKVFVSKSYSYKDKKNIESIKNWAGANDISFEEIENSTLYKIENLPFSVENMPEIFTHFRKKIEEKAPVFNYASVKNLPMPIDLNLNSYESLVKEYENVEGNDLFKGGEKSAQKRVDEYLWQKERAKTYKETRNGMIDFDDSTKFSPWLSLGCVSPISIMTELKEFENKIEKNESTYWIYFELLWREYFKIYALKYGEKIFSINGLGKKAFKVSDSKNLEEDFNKWTSGETDESFINANMKELFQTGWMSNRGRQNVASYLSKHLCLDWRWGAEWFERHLIDYDVESNWGNWNYVAGVGTDPRDRKFNIQRQADIYDPQSEYKEKWL